MPDIARILDMKFCHSSYEEPIAEIGGWRIFMDGFIPSAGNTALVGKILAWNPITNGEPIRYYCSLVGVENGAFEYQKGADFPVSVKSCVVDPCVARLSGEELIAFVREEINVAIFRLVLLISDREKISVGEKIQIPDYPVNTCTCCGQTLSEDVLRRMGL